MTVAELVEQLKFWANLKTCFEQDNDYAPWVGGNYDDAHEDGVGDGKIHLAREILKEMGIAYD